MGSKPLLVSLGCTPSVTDYYHIHLAPALNHAFTVQAMTLDLWKDYLASLI